jgi:hypothetical protein
MAVMDRELHVLVPSDMYRTLAEQAAREDRPVSRLVRQALRAYVGVAEPKVK